MDTATATATAVEALPKTATIDAGGGGGGGGHHESSDDNNTTTTTTTTNQEESNAAITSDHQIIERVNDNNNNNNNNNNINLVDSGDDNVGINREGEATSAIRNSTARPIIKQSTSNNETRELEQQQQQQQRRHRHPIPSSRESSSSATTTTTTTTTALPATPDEENIDKAEAFLLNPEITNVPTEKKRRYLESKGNLTNDEINVALGRVAGSKTRRDGIDVASAERQRRRVATTATAKAKAEDGMPFARNGEEEDDENRRQTQTTTTTTSRDGGYYDDRERGRSGMQRHSNDDRFRDTGQPNGNRRDSNQYYRGDDDRQYDNPNPRHRGGGGGDGSMGERRPHPSSSQYPTPHHDSNTTTMPPYNNNNNMHSPPPGTTAEEMMPPPTFPSSILPAWAGGFTFGIVCLAALRWLNGGDFVLFPPPSLASSSSSSSSSDRSAGVEPTVGGASVATKEEEEVGEDDTDESRDSLQEEEDVIAEEEADYEEEEVGVDQRDESLNMILNDTANLQHHQQQQPSYDELVLEIRALTTAIHSYRDVQERANRNASAKVGKGMTDDAMDFLRQKKKTVDADVSSGGEGIGSNLATMLTEVNGDLSRLKESIPKGSVADADDAKESEGDADGADEIGAGEKGEEEEPSVRIDKKSVGDDDTANEIDADKKDNGEEEPTAQIDKVMEKVQRMLTVVEKLDSNKKYGAVDTTDTKSDGGAPDESEKESKSTVPSESNAVSSTASSPTPSIQSDEKVQQSDNNPEHPPSAIEEPPSQSNEELEEALRNLSNDNDPAHLKVGAQMLYLYCLNISKNPSVPRYRKIYTNNANFKNKVGNLTGAKDFLLAVGFAERTNFFEWAAQQPPSSEEDVSSSSSSSVTKSRLDFALVALDLMKNGVVSKSKPKNEESVLASSSSLSESNVEIGGTKEIPGLALSAVLSVPCVGKGVDLN